MKSWGRNIILLATSVLALTASAAVKLPKPKGTGPEMLLFCGSRAEGTKSLLTFSIIEYIIQTDTRYSRMEG